MHASIRLVFLFILASCAPAGEQLAELRAKNPQNTNFSEALATEYLAYGESLAEEYEYRRADYFAGKGLVALAEGDVAPEENADFLNQRQELLLVMTDDIKNVAPSKAARAQLLFDCWVEGKAVCAETYPPALADLQFIADMLVHGGGNHFTVSFPAGSSELSSKAESVLDVIAAKVIRYGRYQIEIIPVMKNKDITKQRLLALKAGLITRGIQDAHIHSHRAKDKQEVFLSADQKHRNIHSFSISIQTYGQPLEAESP